PAAREAGRLPAARPRQGRRVVVRHTAAPPARRPVGAPLLFPTVTFAVFFMIVLPVSWALMGHQRAWRVWILLASYAFYGWWNWHFVFLLAASTVVNHVLAVAIHRARSIGARKSLLALAVGFDLGLLAYFKYTGFFVSSFDNLVGTSWIVDVTLPVGISF